MGRSCCRVRRSQYVEPVLFVYSYWLFLAWLIMGQYYYYRISDDIGFPFKNLTKGRSCGEVNFGVNSTLKELEIQVQTKSANLFTYYIVCSVGSSVVISTFMGSYSDKRGRKIPIVAPLVGATIETSLLLVMVYFELSLYLTILGGFINGLTGYLATLWMGVTSYIADTVEKKKLSFRLAVLQLAMFLAATVAQLTSGLWIENLGFKAPLWFLWGSLVLITLYTVLFIKETIEPNNTVRTSFFSYEALRKTLHTITKEREGRRRNIILLMVIVGVNVLAKVGTDTVQVLYVLRSPLCWLPSILGYYLAYRFFTLGIGSVAGVYILKKCLGEINICKVSFLSQLAGLLLLAFSNKTWMVFLVPAIGVLGSVAEPVLSSIASRLVSTEEQGILFAMIGIISGVGDLVGSTLFNTIYPLSFRFHFPGFVFVLAAGITLLLIVMLSCVTIPVGLLDREEDKKDEWEVCMNPSEDETDTTRL